jgi:trehalose/maltose hydrolase-like predicted phosphorylase
MPNETQNNVDNPAFTIASAADLLSFANYLRREQGLPENETWAKQAANIQFPRAASNITLEYQTMTNSVQVKQADVVLLTYPLDYGENGYSPADKLLDLDFVSLSTLT